MGLHVASPQEIQGHTTWLMWQTKKGRPPVLNNSSLLITPRQPANQERAGQHEKSIRAGEEEPSRHGLEIFEKLVCGIGKRVGQTALKDHEMQIDRFQFDLLPPCDTLVRRGLVIALDGGRTFMREAKRINQKRAATPKLSYSRNLKIA